MFDGQTYVPERDEDRLRAQLARVFVLMRDGEWRTLNEISANTGDPPASVSARLRDFRKDKFGGHTVERHYVETGLFRYRLLERGKMNGQVQQQYKLGKVDLSQIECRLLNTLAGQWDVIEKFRTGVDIYSELASQFYGFAVSKAQPAERGTGKQLELSCGYGAGGLTIVRTARAGTYGPPVRLTEQQGMQARDLYRRTHPFVTALWERGSRLLWSLQAGHRIEWGPPGQSEPCIEIRDHRIFHVESGLWLDFTSLHRARLVLDSGEEVWLHRVREGMRKTYGARLIENIVQWLARIVISDAMKRILAMGYHIPLTVHDDVFILIPANGGEQKTLQKCAAIVGQTLPWMPACPIAVEFDLLDALDK